MSEPTDEQLDRIAAAIEAAQCPGREGPYGLYDYGYSNPNPPDEPYCVRDFRDTRAARYGMTVFRSADRATAETKFEELTRRHVARAAWNALQAPK